MPLKPRYQEILDTFTSKYGKEQGVKKFWSWVESQNLRDKVDIKSYLFFTEIKSVDNDYVEGYITTSDLDTYDDVVTKKCMVDMAKQMDNMTLKVDIEHEAFKGDSLLEKQINKTKTPIAKIVEHKLDDKGIWVKAILNQHHPRYNEIKNSIRDGFIDAFSIAYIPTVFYFKQKEEKRIRYLDNINLLNVAFTGIPVNDNASFTAVAVKSLQDMDFDDITSNTAIANLKEEELDLIEVKNMKEEYKSILDKVKDTLSEEEMKSLSDVFTVASEEKEVVEETKNEDTEKKADKKKEDKKKVDKKKEDEEEEDDKEKMPEKKSSEELKSLIAKVNDLEAKSKEFDEILSKPIFKSKMEQMEQMLKTNEETKSKVEAVISQPLDVFKR